MEELLRQPDQRVVGTKQVLRAVRDGRASRVFLCKDADEFIYRQVESACEEHHIPVTVTESMEKLGKLCLVGVKTAAAALLK
ncbi:MAG TPA: ribosomal L7Ae/L30e/S12e/Gadd45 family protein [Candidatus Limiplasma sp.]|jgi:large subunit ribosomal protein L7A|nr:ribosomal L7Ae/L30e/S12e/Gadd45 family protein [Candidatus Limiplasma sp.]HPS82474.1 ribosomal L7Ae/L30e/S12e/Gadd45 family protein [Candidatus Limiplasma sp.]